MIYQIHFVKRSPEDYSARSSGECDRNERETQGTAGRQGFQYGKDRNRGRLERERAGKPHEDAVRGTISRERERVTGPDGEGKTDPSFAGPPHPFVSGGTANKRGGGKIPTDISSDIAKDLI